MQIEPNQAIACAIVGAVLVFLIFLTLTDRPRREQMTKIEREKEDAELEREGRIW